MAVQSALYRQQPELGGLARRLEDAVRQVAETPLAGAGEIQVLCLDSDKLYYLPIDAAHDLSAERREQLQTMLSAALGFRVLLVRAEEA